MECGCVFVLPLGLQLPGLPPALTLHHVNNHNRVTFQPVSCCRYVHPRIRSPSIRRPLERRGSLPAGSRLPSADDAFHAHVRALQAHRAWNLGEGDSANSNPASFNAGSVDGESLGSSCAAAAVTRRSFSSPAIGPMADAAAAANATAPVSLPSTTEDGSGASTTPPSADGVGAEAPADDAAPPIDEQGDGVDVAVSARDGEGPGHQWGDQQMSEEKEEDEEETEEEEEDAKQHAESLTGVQEGVASSRDAAVVDDTNVSPSSLAFTVSLPASAAGSSVVPRPAGGGGNAGAVPFMYALDETE